jgi:RHS repeat-associated protein
MTDGSGTTTYSYDSLDRPTAKATPEGTLSYGYDAASNVASVSSNHANGVSVSYAYDQLNRLSTVTDARLHGSPTTTYIYDPASNVATVNYANGVQSVMTYDALNRITGLATQNSGYLYQRGPTGNLTYGTELNGRTLNWTYDGIYRLTDESITSDPSHNNGTASYTLDPVGNRLAESTTLPGLSSGSFGYNADDEVNTETYDANGNTLATGGKAFAYDAENHLTSMNGGAVTIVYDGDGNRVSKTANGVTTQYLVDDMNPTGYPQVVEELVSGAVTRQYTYGLQRVSQNQFISNTWTVSFYGYDGGGNVRNLTNTTGAITDEYEYDAYGNSFTKVGTTPNVYLFRGEQYDPDLGLYYLRARYYNPLTGRFMSRDPLDGNGYYPKTLHKYLYAGGDPVDAIDPTGRDLFDTVLIEGGSLPAYPGVTAFGYLVSSAICGAGNILAKAFSVWPPAAPSPIGIPVWSLKLLAILCTANGF